MATPLAPLIVTWLRRFRGAPAYPLSVVGTLAVAIAAAATLFAVTDAVVLRPLPFPAPDELVAIWESDQQAGYPKFRVAPGNFADWVAQNRSFSSMALFGGATHQATGDGEPEQLLGARVTGSYFSVLGVQARPGRVFGEADERPGAQPVAVIAETVWTRRYARRPDIIGHTIRLDGLAHTIVGVLPRGTYPTWPRTTGGLEWASRYQEIWTPLRLSPELAATRRAHVFGVVARLKPGVPFESAQRSLDALARRLATTAPATNANTGIVVTRLGDEVSGDVRFVLFVLLGAVGLVLLAACATLTNLALVRSAARRPELAVRASLGASRSRLVGSVIGETMILGTVGGVLGTILARASLGLVLSLAPGEMPRAGEAHVDGLVVVFSLVLSLAVGFVVGVVPAWQAAGIEPADALRAVSRGGAGSARASRLRRLLVAVEVATAVMLLVGGVLAGRSFLALTRVDLGFSPSQVLTFELSLPAGAYRGADRLGQFQDRLLAALATTPGVRSAAIGYDLPLEATWVDAYAIEGRPPGDAEVPSALLKIASASYFDTLSVPLVAGRAFTTDDRRGRPGVVVVNRAFARREFPRESPIGRRLTLRTPSMLYADAPTSYEIVGVVSDVHSRGIDASPPPAFYLAAQQFPQAGLTVFIRSSGDPLAALGAVRGALRRLDPQLPLTNVMALDAHVAAALARPRFILTVLAGFGASVFLLAALGIYGFMSYAVAERRSELAVRLAVGASPATLARLVIGEGGFLTAIGLVSGLAAAAVATRVLQTLWFGVDALDPPTFGLVAMVVGALATTASIPPALRASRIDPASVLRG